MKLNFLVVTDDPYMIEEAVNNGLLVVGDWFEYEGDIYLLSYNYDNKDYYVGYKAKREGIEREDIRNNYKLITYKEYANYADMYERNGIGNEFTSYHFDKGDKIRLIWVRQ